MRSKLNEDTIGHEDSSVFSTTTTSHSRREVPWSHFPDKDFTLDLGDTNDGGGNDIHDDEDYVCHDESHDDTDFSEDEFVDKVDTGGINNGTVPAMRQTCGSNQYGELLGRAAQFGKPYLPQGDQEKLAMDTSKGSAMNSSHSIGNQLGSRNSRAVSHKTIRNSGSAISGAFSTSWSTGSLSDTTATADDGCKTKNRVQRRVSGGGRSGESDFKRTNNRSSNLRNEKGGQLSGLDDNDDSASDSSESEDDDAPNIDIGFGMNTRVFMADGTTKRIKNIQPGEYVLGPDREPRAVITTSIGRSLMIQVRELTQNVVHRPDSTDNHFGLVTFICTPKQGLRLATGQCQGNHVRHDVKQGLHVVNFHQLKRMQDSMIVVHSSKSFQDSLPNARQEADAFARSRSKD
ncbi:H(+)-transporting V1 sector ATPase subunit A, partial [Mortierella alpina]